MNKHKASLLEAIFEETETKGETAVIETATEDETVIIDEVAAPVQESEAAPGSEAAPEQQKESGKVKNPIDAGNAINLIDGLQILGFSKLHQKKQTQLIFGNKEARLTAEKALSKVEAERDEIEKGEVAKMQRYFDVLQEKTAKLPLSATERQLIEDPLSKLMTNAQKDIPPGMALVLAALIIAIPRISDI
jgi:hypothetical protein